MASKKRVSDEEIIASKDLNVKIVKIIILTIFVVGISVLAIRFYNTYSTNINTVIKEVPLISAQVQSSSSNEVHNVKTNVSFRIDKKLYEDYNEEEMVDIINKTLERVDFDRLYEADGTEYLKREISKNTALANPDIVNEYFNVYISGYDLGISNGYIPGMITNEKNGGKNRDEKILEMFGN